MKILLVGSGGREHALGAGLQADPACTELHVAPGNPGIAQIAQCHPLVITDNQAILELAQRLNIDLVVIGPEVPLVNGVADILRAANIAVFGPSKAAQDYVAFLEKISGAPMSAIGVGPGRDETIVVKDFI